MKKIKLIGIRTWQDDNCGIFTPHNGKTSLVIEDHRGRLRNLNSRAPAPSKIGILTRFSTPLELEVANEKNLFYVPTPAIDFAVPIEQIPPPPILAFHKLEELQQREQFPEITWHELSGPETLGNKGISREAQYVGILEGERSVGTFRKLTGVWHRHFVRAGDSIFFINPNWSWTYYTEARDYALAWFMGELTSCPEEPGFNDALVLYRDTIFRMAALLHHYEQYPQLDELCKTSRVLRCNTISRTNNYGRLPEFVRRFKLICRMNGALVDEESERLVGWNFYCDPTLLQRKNVL